MPRLPPRRGKRWRRAWRAFASCARTRLRGRGRTAENRVRDLGVPAAVAHVHSRRGAGAAGARRTRRNVQRAPHGCRATAQRFRSRARARDVRDPASPPAPLRTRPRTRARELASPLPGHAAPLDGAGRSRCAVGCLAADVLRPGRGPVGSLPAARDPSSARALRQRRQRHRDARGDAGGGLELELHDARAD